MTFFFFATFLFVVDGERWRLPRTCLAHCRPTELARTTMPPKRRIVSIAVFRSVRAVVPRALSGLAGTPAVYPRPAQRESARLCLGDTLRDTLIRATLSPHRPLRPRYNGGTYTKISRRTNKHATWFMHHRSAHH